MFNIQFGLHATSIQDRFGDLQDLDAHITIVWEDAGALFYAYLPQIEDGILEEQIQTSVALYAETLWNPYEHPETVLNRAHSLYYQGLF